MKFETKVVSCDHSAGRSKWSHEDVYRCITCQQPVPPPPPKRPHLRRVK